MRWMPVTVSNAWASTSAARSPSKVVAGSSCSPWPSSRAGRSPMWTNFRRAPTERPSACRWSTPSLRSPLRWASSTATLTPGTSSRSPLAATARNRGGSGRLCWIGASCSAWTRQRAPGLHAGSSQFLPKTASCTSAPCRNWASSSTRMHIRTQRASASSSRPPWAAAAGCSATPSRAVHSCTSWSRWPGKAKSRRTWTARRERWRKWAAAARS
mmetsp:Transcript_183363/g.581532  ORF Transcript_183363/g.581532 Transcript_183363/m.581532 type:complete len:214 (-) Transcript_183363:2195-2836(-)